MAFIQFTSLACYMARIRKARRLRRYNRFTSAGYLRGQGAQNGKHCGVIPTSAGDDSYFGDRRLEFELANYFWIYWGLVDRGGLIAGQPDRVTDASLKPAASPLTPAGA